MSISNDKTDSEEEGSDIMERDQGGNQHLNKKCRYYNRGFCKFGRSCKFHHPTVVCDEYLQDGVCTQRRCPKRHPRHCRYWSTKPEGCTRNEKCQYLHVASNRFSDRSLFTVYEEDNENESDSCDPCDNHDDNHDEDTHR